MRDFAFVRDESTTLGGLIAMPRQSVTSDLMSVAARYNSFTLSLQSTIFNGGLFARHSLGRNGVALGGRVDDTLKGYGT